MTDNDTAARERNLDEAIEETFPASDAPANTVETGSRVGGERLAEAVSDNPAANRFELTVDGATAVLQYERRPQSLVLIHTEVPAALRGRQIGHALAKAAVDSARADGVRVIAVCPFVKDYLVKHPPSE